MPDRYFTIERLLAWVIMQDGQYSLRGMTDDNPIKITWRLAELKIKARKEGKKVPTLRAALRKIEYQCRTGRIVAKGIRGNSEGASHGEREVILPNAWLDLQFNVLTLNIESKPERAPVVFWHAVFKGDEIERALSSPRGVHKAAMANPMPVVKAKRGARPKYDWEDAELHLRGRLDEKGDFEDVDQVESWSRQADAEKLTANYLSRNGAEPPSESVVRNRVVSMVARWRAGRAQAKAGKSR